MSASKLSPNLVHKVMYNEFLLGVIHVLVHVLQCTVLHELFPRGTISCPHSLPKVLYSGPSYMVSGTLDNPPPETSLSNVYI